MNHRTSALSKKLKVLALQGDFVCVYWDDIVAYSGWEPSDTANLVPPHKCISYGFLTNVGEDYLSISATRGVNGKVEYNQSISIPLGCISEIKTITV